MAYNYPPGYTPGVPGGAGYPPGAAGYPPGAAGYPPGAAGYPPGAVGYPGAGYPTPMGVGYPPGAGAIAAGAAVVQAERRCFYIVAEWNGEVLDISREDARPGAMVITFRRKMERSPNQLWHCDHTGVIKSALNDFALEARQFETFRMMPYTGQPDQQWIFAGNRIVNRAMPNECLTDREGERPCHVKPYKGKARQHWRVEMI